MAVVGKKSIQIMPYSLIRGQAQVKLALELVFVAPRIGGVLLSGQRGTGKSTAVRAFAAMMYDGELPITLPINATEDRVVGGWQIEELLRGNLVPQRGLLEEADGRMLYIDEVNLLDDHIVNIILDVTSTGILVVEREGKHEQKDVHFTLVGTMNPSEGGLRPQLLDRFALMVDVAAPEDNSVRAAIVKAVLDYDAALLLERYGMRGQPLTVLETARAQDIECRNKLQRARADFSAVGLSDEMAERCVRVGRHFQTEGHRGDYVMALAARAHAALRKAPEVAIEDLVAVAPLALQHRRSVTQQGGWIPWTANDNEELAAMVADDARRTTGG